MARARNIKPAFFSNEELAELPFEARLLFIGLWTLADREGRLEDRPKRIKMAIFPADNIDVEPSLSGLERFGLITRHTFDGIAVIQITNFIKHQRPHGAEKDSELPCSSGFYIVHKRGRNGLVIDCEKFASYTKQQLTENKNSFSTVQEPTKTVPAQCKNTLNPECGYLIPDTLNAECGNLNAEVNTFPHQQAGAPATFELVVPDSPKAKKQLDPDEQQGCREAWAGYAQAYQDRYAVAPVRNAAVNAKVKQLVKRLGRDEAPGVCRFYVESVNDAFVVKKMHDMGLLLQGCEGYRTQWITGKAVTGESAKRVEKTQDFSDKMDEISAMIDQQQRAAQ